MPTEENQTTWTSVNPNWSSQTSSTSSKSDVSNLNESKKIDTLDIDLNLDGIDLPLESDVDNKNWEINDLDLFDVDVNKISDESEQINFSDINFSFDWNKENEVEENNSDNTEVVVENIVEQNNDLKKESNEIVSDIKSDNDWLTEEENEIEENISDNTEVVLKNIVEQNNDVKEENNETVSGAKSDNDWLTEDTKIVEDTISVLDNNIVEGDTVVDTKPGLLDDEKTLDIPFIWPTKEINSNNEKIDDLSDIFGDEDVVNSQDWETFGTGTNNETKNLEEVKVEYSIEKKPDTLLLVENLGESVVQNKQWDIVSDTGEFNWSSNQYVPNERDFNQVTEMLNSNPKWPIDLWPFSNVNNNKQWLDLWNNAEVIQSQNTNNWIDLDAMISSFDVKTPVAEDLINTVPVMQAANIADGQINGGNGVNMEVPKSIDLVIDNTNLNSQVTPTYVKNNQSIDNQSNSIQAGVSLNKKASYSGIKIFVLIVLLLVGWFMILSKMYPQEIRDIMDAIQNGNKTSIEYSDNSDMWVILDETEDVFSWDTLDEELDPDSLAAQLENLDENMTWNGLEYYEDDITPQHGAGDSWSDFEVFDNIIESNIDDSENGLLLEKLNTYIKRWTEFNEWGRSKWNSTAMKYGTYIFTKASLVVNDIENVLEIDNTKVENYFAQFDIYLWKLEWLRNSIEWDVTADIIEQVQNDDLTSTLNDESISEQSGWTIQ